jgi:hypothetical protein
MVEVDEVCDESIGFGSNYEVLQNECLLVNDQFVVG